MIREPFLGFVNIQILYHASREEVTGVGMAAEFTRQGCSMSPGALYQTLRKLERDGYLKSGSRVEGGRRRICCTATASGMKAPARAREQARERCEEISEDS